MSGASSNSVRRSLMHIGESLALYASQDRGESPSLSRLLAKNSGLQCAETAPHAWAQRRSRIIWMKLRPVSIKAKTDGAASLRAALSEWPTQRDRSSVAIARAGCGSAAALPAPPEQALPQA
eukprot:CAMPEP_0171228708 /NCGR_PEP_ID=MMETSP0790-20130122/38506_1 /TAXON_ID=2925 /ORGANISM="Alexandrium catenella, Strain OF101" /LENGTH=121 /DNA_ID=CAMNT_0011694869 /DNA_START=343 /DNA_END=704 /DNA_ORIENTATION=+